MTRDEILNMEAGREMDAAVAAGPMQLEVLGNVRTTRDPCGGYDVPYKHPDSGLLLPVYVAHCACDVGERFPSDDDYWGHYAACLRVVPRYSTDWAAAGEVVEKLEDLLGARLDLIRLGWKPSFIGWRAKFRKHAPFGYFWSCVDASTAPLAICRAALLATLEANHD